MKNLQVSECILKSTRCPKSSQYRPNKTDPFPKQGTELKKNQAFSHGANTYDIASTKICRLQGSLFVMRKYRDVLGADQTESGIWVREIDHVHYRKRKLVTLRLRCEGVSNSLNISRTKKCRETLWEPCDNLRMFNCWYDLSDTAKAAVIGGPFWRWTLRQYVVTNYKQFNLLSNMSLQRFTTLLRGGVKKS